MIEIGKKYRLKSSKAGLKKIAKNLRFFIVGCVAPDGKRYVFDKDFLIDPDKPNEIYADIKITKG